MSHHCAGREADVADGTAVASYIAQDLSFLFHLLFLLERGQGAL